MHAHKKTVLSPTAQGEPLGNASVLATVPASSTTFPSRSEVFESLPRHPSPARHVDKTCKYPLPTVARLKDIDTHALQELEKAEPPVYATQTGKTKGRKAKKAVAELDTKNQKKKKEKNNKSKNKKKLKTAKQRAVAAYKARAQEQMEQPKAATGRHTTKTRKVSAAGSSSTTKRATPPTAPSAKKKTRSKKSGVDEPKEYVPPEHVTGNHVYSSAYRRAKSLNLSEGEARNWGQEASAHFKKFGTVVEGKCGVLLGLDLWIQYTATLHFTSLFYSRLHSPFHLYRLYVYVPHTLQNLTPEIRFRSKPRANKYARVAEAPDVD